MIKFRQFVSLQEAEEFAPIQEMLEGFLTTEEFQQLDEISKETLKSYIKKAKGNNAPRKAVLDKAHKTILAHGMHGWDDKAQKASETIGRNKGKFFKRREGIELATKKLSEAVYEELMLDENFQQLDELSKKTLASYIDKAVVGLHANAWVGGYRQHADSKTAANDESKRAIKRMTGVRKAAKKLSESPEAFWAPLFESNEFQQLDELSKKTLGNYIMHATQSYANAQEKTNKYRDQADTISRMDHNLDHSAKASIRGADDALRQAAKTHERTRLKRGQGVMRALKRLTAESIIEMLELDEEFQQLDELSKKTLGSYIRKASNHKEYLGKQAAKLDKVDDDFAAAWGQVRDERARGGLDKAREGIRADQRKIQNKSDNRTDGIRRAVSRLVKEGLDESWKNNGHTTLTRVGKSLEVETMGKKHSVTKDKDGYSVKDHQSNIVHKLPWSADVVAHLSDAGHRDLHASHFSSLEK